MLDPNIRKYLSLRGKKGGETTAKLYPGMAKEWGKMAHASGGLAKRRKRQLSTDEEKPA